MATSPQPTTIPDPSNPASSSNKSDHVIAIVLAVLLGTGATCIAAACYINIKRRNRALKSCANANNTGSRDVEAGADGSTSMVETQRAAVGRIYYNGFHPDGSSISQTALTGPAIAYSMRSASLLDRRSSLNSSMFDGFRSPAGSTFANSTAPATPLPQVGRNGEQEDDEDEHDVPMEEPPPRYEMAVQEPPAVELDISSSPISRTGSIAPSFIAGAATDSQVHLSVPPTIVVQRTDDDVSDSESLYRAPTPPQAGRSRRRET